MGIPSELRTMVFRLMLPKRSDRWVVLDEAQHYTSNNHVLFMRDSLEILRINRTCYAETLQIIHDRTVSIGIGSRAFTRFSGQGRSRASGLGEHMQEVEKRGLSWRFGLLMPGTPFSRLRELEIVVEPINALGFWYSVRSLLGDFCQRRLHGENLKLLTIKLMDMM